MKFGKEENVSIHLYIRKLRDALKLCKTSVEILSKYECADEQTKLVRIYFSLENFLLVNYSERRTS